MRKIVLIAFILLSITIGYAQYCTQIYQKSVRTLRVRYAEENALLQRPVLFLKNGVVDGTDGMNTLEISFDELSHNVRQYSYKVLHCNMDWSVSGISSYEYVDGFTTSDIIDYEFSVNTQQEYIHYSFVFPNEDMQLKASGNYMLQVYEDGDQDNIVAQVCFLVVEPLVSIDAKVRPNTDIELNGRYQQLDIDVQTAALNVRDAQDIKVVVTQNGRIDNQVTLEKPTFVEPKRLRYTNQAILIFEGGNEFRRFDSYSSYYAGYHVDIVEYKLGEYHVLLDADDVRGVLAKGANREGTVYLTEPDVNGQWVINCEKADYPDVEAEYMWVHFYLPVQHPLMNVNVFVGGDLFYNQYTAENLMQYDVDQKCYFARAYLKQGGYNYMYYAVSVEDRWQTRDSRVEVTTLPLEGSHWQTENEYSISIYYRPFGERYDRLVGYKVQ